MPCSEVGRMPTGTRKFEGVVSKFRPLPIPSPKLGEGCGEEILKMSTGTVRMSNGSEEFAIGAEKSKVKV